MYNLITENHETPFAENAFGVTMVDVIPVLYLHSVCEKSKPFLIMFYSDTNDNIKGFKKNLQKSYCVEILLDLHELKMRKIRNLRGIIKLTKNLFSTNMVT